MFKSIYYDKYKGEMHLFEQVDGFNNHRTIQYVPYLFEKIKHSHIKTPSGIPARKLTFNNYREYKEYDENNTCFENKMTPEIQFLVDQYHHINDEDLVTPKLKIGALDIEVYSNDGFPDPYECKHPINLLSVFNNQTNKATAFGLEPYTNDNPDIEEYHHCKNEVHLLKAFFNHLHKEKFDIITGWNLINFDISYIMGRVNRLELKDYKKASQVNMVQTWLDKKEMKYRMNIVGTTLIDYLDLYKKYGKKLSNYKLQTVLTIILDKGKLDYSEYVDLNDLCKKNWNKYVEYNIIDVKRIIELDNVLGYIQLIQSLSVLSRTPLIFYNTVTKVIEGIHLTYFRRNDMCAPYFDEYSQQPFPAAFVKEPKPGLYADVIDLDITSSYPSHIITLNMGNETYFGKIISLSEEEVVRYTSNRKFQSFKFIDKNKNVKLMEGNILDKFNETLLRGMFCISPCGTIFKSNPISVMADIESSLFDKRAAVKKKMKKLSMNNGDKETLNQLNSLQLAIKTILNSMFGVMAVPYSRYCNVHIAEAITSCGRHTIKQGERFCNELLNNPNQRLLDILKEIDN